MPNAWLIVGLLWVIGCLNYLDRLMITTMRGSIKDAIPMTEAQFGLLTTIVLVVYGVCSPFAGFFADFFRVRACLTLALSLRLRRRFHECLRVRSLLRLRIR